MATPIEELTAREQEEGRKHTTGAQQGKPVQIELATAVEPVVGPLAVVHTPTPAVSPTAPTESKPLAPSFLRHLAEEIEEEEAKEE